MILALSAAALLALPPKDSWFGADKVKHFFMSAMVQSVTYSAARAAGVSQASAQAIGGVTTGVVGLGRELHDRRQGRIFSVKDLVWDAGGGVAAASLLRRTR
jgi:uncharacterized protein YfiM (DUF2279 family)